MSALGDLRAGIIAFYPLQGHCEDHSGRERHGRPNRLVAVGSEVARKDA